MYADHSRRGFLARLSAAFVAAPALPATMGAAREATPKTITICPSLCHYGEHEEINVIHPGSGYLVVPEVTFSGGEA